MLLARILWTCRRTTYFSSKKSTMFFLNILWSHPSDYPILNPLQFRSGSCSVPDKILEGISFFSWGNALFLEEACSWEAFRILAGLISDSITVYVTFYAFRIRILSESFQDCHFSTRKMYRILKRIFQYSHQDLSFNPIRILLFTLRLFSLISRVKTFNYLDIVLAGSWQAILNRTKESEHIEYRSLDLQHNNRSAYPAGLCHRTSSYRYGHVMNKTTRTWFLIEYMFSFRLRQVRSHPSNSNSAILLNI